MHSTAVLTGYQSEYAVLNEGMRNEALNAVDGTLFAWGRLWPLLGEWYGVTPTRPELDETKFTTVTLHHSPPPRGYVAI